MTLLTPFLFSTAIQATTPILLAALAGALCSRVGVFNMALEGLMLVGAFAAAATSYAAQSALVGACAAMATGAVFSLILAFGATVLAGNPVVICIGMNLLASGLTAYLLRAVFGVSGTFSDPGILGLAKISLPFLQAVPLIGWGFARQTFVTWFAWGLTALIAVILFRTPVGLRLRGVGEQPDAAETLGVNVNSYRIAVVVIAGALAGLGGAQLAIGAVTVFTEDMTAGRGWIAVVAVMLGRAHPVYSALACLLFGFADAVGIKLQGEGLPNQLTDIAPYAVTLAALAITHRRRSGVAGARS
jgi:simple sugar transport system permease protein